MIRNNMYSKMQRYLSYLLIFSILFSNTFYISLFESTKAEALSNTNIVSIIVDETSYDNLSLGGFSGNRLDRYAKDIEGKLDNTRVIIYKIHRDLDPSKDINPAKIAQLNEKLFYEGDGNKLSRLIGTILVGNVPLPVIHSNGKTFLSVYPYIDFNEKNFVYNAGKGFYEATNKNIEDKNPEIWHSVISPNTGNSTKDSDKLKDFFDKTDAFYNKSGVFSSSALEPSVFYFDGVRDQLTLQTPLWKGYLLYLQNLEDLTYKRINKYLAKKIYNTANKTQSDELSGVLGNLAGSSGNSMDFSIIPDGQTNTIISKSIKKFAEVFNAKHISDMLNFVYNTGRYGDSNVSVDSPAEIITKKDQIMAATLKDINTVLEDNIDKLVSNGGLSRNLALPIKVNEKIETSNTDIDGNCILEETFNGTFENFYFGKKGSDVGNVKDCSIYRGTRRLDSNKSVLAEENRAYDINKIKPDIDTLSQSPNSMTYCRKNDTDPLYLEQWGGNSPINLDLTSSSLFSLKGNDYRNATIPLFDVSGGKQIGYNDTTDNQDIVLGKTGKPIETVSPDSCVNFNFIQTDVGGLSVFNCKTINNISNAGSAFENLYKNIDKGVFYTNTDVNVAHDRYIYLDNSLSKDFIESNGQCLNYVSSTYYFKSIPSINTHKSPDEDEYSGATMNMIEQSLASDRDRYVDFISAKGNLEKIIYPNLFRLKIPNQKDLEDNNKVALVIKNYLISKNTEINNIINSENPQALSGADKEIYDKLKINNYPSTQIDLNSILDDAKVKDELVKAVIWYNLGSATAKYKYVLEHYLDINGNSPSLEPGHKSDYEMAYIGGKGDSNNMYVKLETAGSGIENSEIQAINDKKNTLKGLLEGANVSSTQKKDDGFKCGPPEGVPIFEWVPKIFCWLKTLVPPISVSSGKCSPSGSQLIPPPGMNVISNEKYNNGNDEDGNGIPDGAELIDRNKNGEIDFFTDKDIYNYDSNISVETRLLNENKLIGVDNSSVVNFDIVALNAYYGNATPQAIYDIDSTNTALHDENNISSFINFSPQKVTAQGGISKFSFGSKQTDVDVYFEASIKTLDKDGNVGNGKGVLNETKDYKQPFLVKIRGNRIDVIARNTAKQSISSINAGEDLKFDLAEVDRFGQDIPLPQNFGLKVYDSLTNEKIFEKNDIDFTVDENGNAIYEFFYNNHKDILKKSGVYKFEFSDKDGIYGSKEITVLPSLLDHINVTPSGKTIVKGGNVQVLVELVDGFGNYTKGNLYQIDGAVTSGGGAFVGGSSKSVLEGFTYFTLKSNEAGSFNIKFSAQNKESEIQKIKVVDYAKVHLDIENKDNIVVGKNKHKIDIKILGSDGNSIEGFDSNVYLNFPKTSGIIDPDYVEIKNGTGSTYFTPNFVAGKNLKIDLNIPGVSDYEGNVIDVLPDVPMSVSENISKTRMEASSSENAKISAALYDRYGNLAYNADNYKINFSIPNDYKTFANFESASYSTDINVTGGIASTNVFATDFPGSAYIVATASPALEANSFDVTDGSGKTITINGYSKDAVALDSYYFFNKEKLDKVNYNSLYTVLLGSNYGNITSEGYLGGEIIFNSGSRSMAVTSLLNNTSSRQIAFSFTPGGKYSENTRTDELDFSLEKEIGSDSSGTYINFYDSVYKDLITRARIHLGDNTQIFNCNGGATDISDCNIGNNSSIVLKGFNNATAKNNGDNLSLAYNGVDLLKIGKNFNLIKIDPSISLDLDNDSKGNILGIKILSNNVSVGYVGVKIDSQSIKTFDGSFGDDGLYIENVSSKYYMDYNYLGNSSARAKGVSFYKNDFGAETQIDKDLVGREGGIEDYENTDGIGWKDNNKMLLEFAAGNNVGDSTKFYGTYSTINLGDPVVSINPKKASVTQDFDKTIGKKIFDSSEPIESYKKIDYNNDGQDDVVIFFEDGKIKLLSNYENQFKDMGYLADVADAGKGRKGVGDFTADGFDDIAMVDNKGNLILLDNINGKFVRRSPKIYDENNNETSLAGAITQLEVFDMDKDGKDDIVILDDSGEINILYGTVKNGETVFVKKFVDNNLGIKIDTTSTNLGGAVYYDGLPQIKEQDQTDKINESKDLLAAVNANSSTLPTDTSETQLNKLIYYRYNYTTPKAQYTDADKLSVINKAVGTDIDGNPNTALASDIANLTKQIASANGAGKTDTSQMHYEDIAETKTFLRSQFSEGKGIKVEKTYTDENGGTLKSGEIVKVNIKLTNENNFALSNFMYLDSNNNGFLQGDNLKYTINNQSKNLNKLDTGDFNYVFDNINIPENGNVEISYELVAPTLSFGDIKVGMLEKTDIYGGISLNPTKKCNTEEIQWKSLIKRNYLKTNKTFTDSSSLPASYIDSAAKLSQANDVLNESKDFKANSGALASYATSAMNDYNKYFGEKSKGDSLFTAGSSGKAEPTGLNSINVDAINSQVDTLIKGLGCGFGGGGCITSPVNYAPLAPGSSPTIFGIPVAPNLMSPSSGIPAFSALTGLPTPVGCLPVVWPISPVIFTPPLCGGALTPMPVPPGPPFAITGMIPLGAGGMLGTTSVTNFFRLYITPTVTGSMGMAACFGGPASVYGNIPPKGTSPMVPGGNCIVAAAPLAGCSDDGSDGDVSSLGSSVSGSGSGNSFINANSCTPQDNVPQNIGSGTIQNIISYVNGNKGLAKSILGDSAVQHGGINLAAGPLMSIGGGGTSGNSSDSDIKIDGNALLNLDMGSVLKVNFKRVSSFPDFIMDWVTRQVEEIVTKLTTLPTLFIILPDFSTLVSDSMQFAGNMKNIFNNFQTASNNVSNKPLGSSLSEIVKNLNEKKSTMVASKNIGGLQFAYKFLSSIPLVDLQTKTLEVNIPWMSGEDANKWLDTAKGTLAQWKNEYTTKSNKWAQFSGIQSSATGSALAQIKANAKIFIDANKLIGSLEKNISVVEEYKNFPDKLVKLLKIKEKYTSQIICNVGIIQDMMGGYIDRNGKRFLSWVKMIILIKAILKSWQVMIDIFHDYKVSCEGCHNERNDLMYFIIKLISALIPQIPVIQFPKWPDVILDLHTIRAGITIVMPDFKLSPKPIILPQLPKLTLPDTLNASVNLGLNFSLPSIPILPALPELPNLPDIPSLPEIKLPDLPPPPTIPNLFGAISGVLSILKLLSKLYCIYQSYGKFFTPEWKAGDSIAFITERNGTMPLDFLFVDMPQFSFSFIDAIKVTSQVNLEFKTDFILQLAKTMTDNFNRFSGEFRNLSKLAPMPDLNFNNIGIPKSVNVNVTTAGAVVKPQSYNSKKDELNQLVYFTIGNFVKLLSYLNENKNKVSDIDDFATSLGNDIKTLKSSSDPRERQVYETMNSSINYGFNKEKVIINELKQRNDEKFNTVKDYLNDEKNNNSKLISELENIIRNKGTIEEFSPLQKFIPENLKVSYKNDSQNYYKEKFDKINSGIVDYLKNDKPTIDDSKIASDGVDFVNGIKKGVNDFDKDLAFNESLNKDAYDKIDKKLLALSSSTPSIPTPTATTPASQDGKDIYSYNYNGFYVIGSDGKQTKLLNYSDEITGEDSIIEMDPDSSGHSDILYKMGDSLYLKNNLSKNNIIKNLATVDVKNIDDYLNISSSQNIFAPNFFKPDFSSQNTINFSFSPGDADKNNRFRLEFYDYINRFDNLANDNSKNATFTSPFDSKLHYTDLITNPKSDDSYISSTGSLFIERNSPVFIKSSKGEATVKMNDYNILNQNESINVQNGKTIYTDGGGASIKYRKQDSGDNYEILQIKPYGNVEFNDNVTITVLSNRVILFQDNIKTNSGVIIDSLAGFPVLPGTKIGLTTNNSEFKLGYFDGNISSDQNDLVINNLYSYEYYNLGEKSDSYDVSLDNNNGFYFGKMYAQNALGRSNMTDLSLFSPQLESDNEAPIINIPDTIKLPVYQKLNYKLKKYVNDISGISDIYLSGSTDGIKKGADMYILDIGPFNTLGTKSVKLYVKDNNGNIATKSLNIEIYAPIPQINFNSGSLVSGVLGEQIENEPIDLYRFRNGVIDRVNTLSPIFSNNNGEFSTSTKVENGLEIKDLSGAVLAYVNERTGKIDLKDAGYSVVITGSDSTEPLKIILRRKSDNKDLYVETLNLITNNTLSRTMTFDNLANKGIYVKLNNGFDLEPIQDNVASSSAVTIKKGGFITKDSNAIVGITDDGNMYLTNPNYGFKYSNFNDYLDINIIDKNDNSVIGEVLYKIDSEFVLK